MLFWNCVFVPLARNIKSPTNKLKVQYVQQKYVSFDFKHIPVVCTISQRSIEQNKTESGYKLNSYLSIVSHQLGCLINFVCSNVLCVWLIGIHSGIDTNRKDRQICTSKKTNKHYENSRYRWIYSAITENNIGYLLLLLLWYCRTEKHFISILIDANNSHQPTDNIQQNLLLCFNYDDVIWCNFHRRNRFQ